MPKLAPLAISTASSRCPVQSNDTPLLDAGPLLPLQRRLTHQQDMGKSWAKQKDFGKNHLGFMKIMNKWTSEKQRGWAFENQTIGVRHQEILDFIRKRIAIPSPVTSSGCSIGASHGFLGIHLRRAEQSVGKAISKWCGNHPHDKMKWSYHKYIVYVMCIMNYQ